MDEYLQLSLQGFDGIFLWKSSTGKPPNRIDDVTFHDVNPDHYNEVDINSKIFHYERNEMLKCWFLNV